MLVEEEGGSEGEGRTGNCALAHEGDERCALLHGSRDLGCVHCGGGWW
jgi:hypothetical protein